MDFSQFDLTDPFVRRALAETLAEDNGLDYQDEYIRKALNDEIAAAAAPKPIDGERNFLGDTVSRLARGGVQLAGTALHAVDTAVGGSETLQGWSDSLDKAKQNVGLLRPDKSEHEEGWLKRSYGQALESAPMSAVPWAGAMAGAKAGAALGTSVFPGVGTAAGLFAGGLIGGTLAMGGLFGLGTYGQRKEEVERELTATRPDLTPDEISKMAHDNAKNHAFAETGGESAGDLASWAILSRVPGGQAIFKGGKAVLAELVKPNAFKAIALGIGKSMPFEVGSEVGTAIWQNEADKAIGVEQGTSTDAALAAIGPALFLSAGMGVAVGGYSANQRLVQYNALNSDDQESRAQAVDQVAGTLAEATDQQTAKKWRDVALGFVQNGQPIPLDMNLAELSANEPEVAAPEAQDQPAETILKAESVDEAIQEAEAEIAKPGWLAPTAPDLEESAWLQQGVAAKAYNQGRNELGATPVSRAGLLGQAMAGSTDIDKTLNEISLERNTMGRVVPEESLLAQQGEERTDGQRQAEAAAERLDMELEYQRLFEQIDQMEGNKAKNELMDKLVSEYQNSGPGWIHYDHGNIAGIENQWTMRNTDEVVSAYSPEFAATRPTTAMLPPPPWMHTKTTPTDEEFTEWLRQRRTALDYMQKRNAKPVKEKATTWSATENDAKNMQMDAEVSRYQTGAPGWLHGDMEDINGGANVGRGKVSGNQGTVAAVQPEQPAGVRDTEQVSEDSGQLGVGEGGAGVEQESPLLTATSKRDAMGRGPKPTRAADEPARAFLALKREWENGVSQTGGNETQAELPRTDETQAGAGGAGEMKKLVASIKKSDAKLEKLHEGQLDRMKNGGQSRATSTTYAARAGNEAKHRDGEARVLANIARAELRAGRAVPQDVLDILGSKIEYNRSGDYEPIEGVTAPSPGEASPPPAAQPSASKATPEKTKAKNYPQRTKTDDAIEKIIALKGVTKATDWIYRIPEKLMNPLRLRKLRNEREQKYMEAPRGTESYQIKRFGDVTGDWNDAGAKDWAIIDQRERYAERQPPTTPAQDRTQEKPAGVATSGQRLPADYDPASDEERFYGSKVTIKEQRALNGKVFRKETTGRVDRVLKGSSGGNVFEVVPDGYEDAFRYDEGDIVIDELVDNKADKKDEVAPVKSGRPSPGQFVPASKEYNSTAQGQKDMSARGSRIAMLKGLNGAVGKVYTDGEIESAADENIDAIRDYLIERQRQEQAAKEPWQMTSGEFSAQELEADEYRDQLEGSAQDLRDFRQNTDLAWRRSVESRAEVGRVPDAALDDYIEKYGEDTFSSMFRGVAEKGRAGYVLPKNRGQEGFTPVAKKYVSDLEPHERTWDQQRTAIKQGMPRKISLAEWKEERANHKSAVQKALWNGEKVPASVLADYPELADAKTRKDADMANVAETDFGNMEQPAQPAQAEAASGERGEEDGIVEHTTKRGKVLRGRIVTGISYRQAKEADPYTFKKDGGFFIREGAGEVKKDDAQAEAKETAPEKGEAQPKENLAIKRLRMSAERLKAAGEAKLNHDRNANTAWRARMANNAEADARADIRTAETLLNIVNAQEDGTAGALAGLTSKAQLETLQGILTQAKYAEERKKENGKQDHARPANKDDIKSAVYLYPHFYDYKDLDALIDLLGNKKGWRTKRNDLRRGGLVVNGKERIEMLREALKLAGDDYRFRTVGEHLKGYDRLQKAVITDDLALREALERLVELSGKAPEKNRAQELERALVGQNNGIDFFPTPKAQAKFIVGRAGIEPGMRVLEPSAGTGNLAEEMRAQGGEVEVAEISPAHREVLEAKGFKIVEHDFMDMEEGGYDVIVMNPPFSNNMDIDHVRKAYELLKPGGRVVAIMGEGAFFRTGKKETEFREWLDEVGINEKLPEGFFTDKKELRTTGVNARVVEIDKPIGAETPVFDEKQEAVEAEQADPTETATVEPEAETETATESPTHLHAVSGYPSDNATKKHMLEAIAEARKELPEPSPKDGFSNAERIDWPKPTTEKSHKIYRLAGNFKLVVDPTGYARLVEDMGSSGKDGSKIQDKVHGKPIGNLAEAKLWAEYYLLGKTEPSGPPHVFRGKNKEYEYTIPNSAYALDNFEKKVKGSSGVKFSERTGPTLESVKAKYAGRIDTIFVHERNDGDIHLASVIVGKGNRQQGIGSEFMADLVAYADASGKRIVLSPGQPDDRHGTTSRARLVRFYKRFGFIENKGRNKDYQISEGMYRVPAPKYSTALPPSARADIPGELTAAFGKLRARVLMRKITVLGSQEEAKALVARLGGKLSAAWHGSPHEFDEFRMSAVGTGEGAQAYGHGLYFAGQREVAEHYKKTLSAGKVPDVEAIALSHNVGPISREMRIEIIRQSRDHNPDESKVAKQLWYANIEARDWPLGRLAAIIKDFRTAKQGRLYKVELAPQEDEYLLWDRPLSEQSEKVRKALEKARSAAKFAKNAVVERKTGNEWYSRLSSELGDKRAASEYLHSLGIRGIKYLDGSSRSKSEGAYNYVIFDEKDIEITAKFSKDGAIQGFAVDGRVYLVKDGVEKGHTISVLKHEFAHMARLGLRGTRPWQALLRSVDERMNEDSATGKALREARKKVPADTNADLIAEETLAYAVELSPEVGLVRRAIAMIKRFLVNMGVSPNIFTVEDWSALAAATLRGQARVAMGEGVRQSVRDLFKPVDTESAAFLRWFGDSKVVDADGKPLRVYRGEHGKIEAKSGRIAPSVPTTGVKPSREEIGYGDFQSRVGSLTFSDRSDAASLYAEQPNDRGLDEIAERPRVIPAYLKIENPIINSPGEPFIDGRDLSKALGANAAIRLFTKHAYWVENTQNWEEINEGYKYDGVGIYLAQNPNGINDLYMDAYPLLDDPEAVSALKAAGYDGAIHGGNGDTADSTEYRVFDESQAKSALSNTGEFSPSDPRIRYSKRFEADEAEAAVQVKPALRKNDLKWWERVFKTFDYLSRLDPASKRIFQYGSEDRRENKVRLEDRILDDISVPDGAYTDPQYAEKKKAGFVSFLTSLQKKDKATYTAANDYLLTVDRTGKAFSVKRQEGYTVKSPDGEVLATGLRTKEDGYAVIRDHHAANYGNDSGVLKKDYSNDKQSSWVVTNPKGAVLSEHDTEAEAVTTRREAEAEKMRAEGKDEKTIAAVMKFREMTDRAFDLMAGDLRRVIDEAERLGLDEPTMEVVDERKRYVILDARGNKVPESYYENRKDAELFAESISHKGRFQVKKQADNEILMPMTLSAAISQMGDLRGSYFPRQRQAGAVVLTATKDGSNIRKNFDLYMLGGERTDIETGEVLTESKIKTFLRDRANRVTPLGLEMARLKADGYTVRVAPAGRMPETVFEATQLFASINALIEDAAKGVKKDADPNLQRAYNELAKTLTMNIADTFKQRGYLSSRMKRTQDYWEGFETDMLEAGVQYAKGMAGGLAKREAAQKMTLALTGRETTFAEYQDQNPGAKWEDYQQFVRDSAIDPKKQPRLLEETKSWMKEMLRNDEQADRILGTIKGLAVLKFLGFRVSSAAVNMTNMVQAVPATIAAQTGTSISRALGQIGSSARAYKQYRTGKAEQADKEIFTEISERGWDNPKFNHEAAAVLRSKAGNWFAKFTDAAMWMFGQAEKVNRAVTIHAAYMQAKRMSPDLGHVGWMNKARQISDDAHGVYGKETAPAWTRGAYNPLKLAYTFQRFMHNYFLNMGQMWERGKYKEMTWMLISPALIAGPGATLLTPIAASMLGALGIGGDDPEEEFYTWAEQTFGEGSTGARVARHGFSGALGVNLKGSLEMGFAMPTTVAELFGAPGSLVTDAVDSVRAFGKGEVSKGFEKALPTGMGTMLKAGREQREGVTTGGYSPVWYSEEPLKTTGGGSVARFFGFNPSVTSGVREKLWSEKRIEQKYAGERKRINDRIRRLVLQNNGRIPREDMDEIRGEVARYNERARGLAVPGVPLIKASTIRQAIRSAKRPPRKERLRTNQNI